MKISFNEEQSYKITHILSKSKISKYEETILDFMEISQSAIEFNDIISFSFLNIKSIGNNKYEINFHDSNNLLFENLGEVIKILSL